MIIVTGADGIFQSRGGQSPESGKFPSATVTGGSFFSLRIIFKNKNRKKLN